jgi:hypothetical protein
MLSRGQSADPQGGRYSITGNYLRQVIASWFFWIEK